MANLYSTGNICTTGAQSVQSGINRTEVTLSQA